MNTISDRGFKPFSWSTIIMFSLGFWLSSSFILDTVIIPSLWATGMMNQAEFASTGYIIFWLFNRIELLCAASILTGFLVIRSREREWRSIFLSGLLATIALIYTYLLTPQMSSLGLPLNLFETNSTMPTAMIAMHEVYWLLEIIKFVVGAVLLRWCYRRACTI
jgi:hypothetical protein